MQLNHLPAVKTRCCSVMPLFSFVGFIFPPFILLILLLLLLLLLLNFTALNKHWKSIESVQIATWCCFNRNQHLFDMKRV